MELLVGHPFTSATAGAAPLSATSADTAVSAPNTPTTERLLRIGLRLHCLRLARWPCLDLGDRTISPSCFGRSAIPGVFAPTLYPNALRGQGSLPESR